MFSSKPLVLIFLTLLIDIIGFGIIIPITPDLLAEIGHYTVSEASSIGAWLIFAFAFSQFIFSPILGSLSDKYGRRPVLLISLLGLGVDFIFMALSHTIWLLVIGRIIAGICGASFTTASSYIADISTPDKRAQNFGLIGVAFGVGFILGPVIGGIVSDINIRAPFWVAASLSLINASICYFYLPESLSKENRREFDIKRANPVGSLIHLSQYPKVLKMMIPLFLLHLASHAIQSNWSYYVKYKFDWDKQMIGYSLGWVGICVSIVQGGLIAYVKKKFGQRKTIFIGFVFYGMGMLLFALANSTILMFVFTMVYTLGGLSGPALQGELSNAVPNNEQGELSGAMTSLMSLTAILGPLMMNNLFTKFTDNHSSIDLPEAPMLLGAFLIFLATIITYRTYKANTSIS